MKANSSKCQFMILSSTSVAPVELSLVSSTYVTSQVFVRVLGMDIKYGHIECYTSSYEDVSGSTSFSTLPLNRLKCMLLTTFKSTQYIIAECLHGIFKTHLVPYDSGPETGLNINVSKARTDWDRYGILKINYGMKSRRIIFFMWNCLRYIFKEFIKQYGGQDLDHFFSIF